MAETTTTPAPATPATTAPAAPAAPAPAETTPAPKSTEGKAITEQPAKGSPGGNKVPPPDQATPGIDLKLMLPMIAVIALMWFWMTRSQKKREQQRQEMLGKLKPGERVITAAGIIGEIVEIKGDEAVIRVDARKDVRMTLRRTAIAGPAGDAASEQSVKEQSGNR